LRGLQEDSDNSEATASKWTGQVQMADRPV
jgi:hypothetical protein